MKRFALRLQTLVLRVLGRLAASVGPRTIRFGKSVFVFRWRDVSEVLTNDADFKIEPVNAKRIEAVSGPFILGMDRRPAHLRQRAAVYGALGDADLSLVENAVRRHADELIAAARTQGAIDIVGGYARPAAAEAAIAYFGVSGPSRDDFARVVRAVFHETFLNLGGDPGVEERGVRAGKDLAEWVDAEILARRRDGARRDVLQALLRVAAENGFWDEEVRWMISGLIVGAVDTTATAVANIALAAFDDQRFYQALRAARADPALLRGWCWEGLRRRPHNPIILREAARNRAFAGARINAGDRLIAVTLAAMQDARAFPAPGTFDPRRPPDRYMHFGYGAHHCAGRMVNHAQIPILVGSLIEAQPRAPHEIVYSGPFPDKILARLT